MEKKFSYSGDYLYKTVEKYTGLSLYEYSTKFTMEKAEGLLLDSDLTIAEIMEDLGYKLISLFEEIYNYKATPEIQKLVDFKEFEKWYDIHRKRISAKATDNAAKKVA